MNRLGGAARAHQWTGVASPTYGGNFFGLTTAVSAFAGGVEAIDILAGVALAEQIEGPTS